MRFITTRTFQTEKVYHPEYLIEDHLFLYSVKGTTTIYNGLTHTEIKPRQGCFICKDQLVRFVKQSADSDIETIVITFPTPFLQRFLERHPIDHVSGRQQPAVTGIDRHDLLDSYVDSLHPYFDERGSFNPLFADIKREELLVMLCAYHAGLKDAVLNFDLPSKVDLLEFMSKNFRFNMSLEQFAYLSGRSLSSFKREFKMLFNETPGQWLTNKRLDEAYFLIQHQGDKPVNFYFDLGFQDLSHFYFSFRKRFGISTKQLLEQSQRASR